MIVPQTDSRILKFLLNYSFVKKLLNDSNEHPNFQYNYFTSNYVQRIHTAE